MNYQDIFHLITIAEKSLQWPQLASIHKAAIKELEGIAREFEPIDAPPPAAAPAKSMPATTFTSDDASPPRRL